MKGLLVQLSEKELSILLSALNYLSSRDEKDLEHHYGSVVRLYDKLKKHHDDTLKIENCACNPTKEESND